MSNNTAALPPTPRQSLVESTIELIRRHIEEGVWKVGQRITLEEGSYEVIGVMPTGFRFPGSSEFWLPLYPRVFTTGLYYVDAIARLDSSASTAQAQASLTALREGSEFCQILVTSHSPDLLDNQEIETESLLAVMNVNGQTQIGPIDYAGREVLRTKLFTPGELLRQNQLAPDEAALSDVTDERQLRLFELNGR